MYMLGEGVGGYTRALVENPCINQIRPLACLKSLKFPMVLPEKTQTPLLGPSNLQ